MQRLFTEIRQRIISGFFLLIPLFLVALLLIQGWQKLSGIVAALAEQPGMGQLRHPVASIIATLVLLLTICFLAGMLLRIAQVGRFKEWLEKNVLKHIPGYRFFRMGMTEKFGGEKSGQYAVLVDFGDSWRPAIQIERTEEGVSVVYIPQAPEPERGAVLVVPSSRVIPLQMPLKHLTESIEGYGQGLADWVARQKLSL